MSWDIFVVWKINSGLWAVGWAGLWKKGLGQLWASFEAHFLSFHGQKINFTFVLKYCRVRTEKLYRMKVNRSRKKMESIFYRGKTSFFRTKNLSVSTKTLWSVLCLLVLWFNNLEKEMNSTFLPEFFTNPCEHCSHVLFATRKIFVFWWDVIRILQEFR